MTIALDHSRLGPSGRPVLTLKRKTEPAPAPAPETSPAPVMKKPLNNRQRKALERHKRADEAMSWLRQKYPSAFNFEYRPLALDTRERLAGAAQEAGLSIRAITYALQRHTKRPRYLRALAHPEAVRIDLEGNPVEPVSEEHRQHASQRFMDTMAEVKKNRKARAPGRAAASKFKNLQNPSCLSTR